MSLFEFCLVFDFEALPSQYYIFGLLINIRQLFLRVLPHFGKRVQSYCILYFIVDGFADLRLVFGVDAVHVVVPARGFESEDLALFELGDAVEGGPGNAGFAEEGRR